MSTIAFDILARDRASTTLDRVGNSASRSSGKLKKFAVVGIGALAGGAVVAGAALVKFTQAAAEDEAAQVRLAKAAKNTAGATDKQVSSMERWISKQGEAKGVADDELRPALGNLLTATKDVGKAQDLAGLAMDVSAGSGKSLSTVSTALMKAQNGQVSSLSRLGINVKDAEGKTISFREATKRMADTFGGQAKTKAETFQGQMDRLKVKFDETKESIGAKLLPILTKLAGWFLDKGLPAMGRMWETLKGKLQPAFEAIGNFIRSRVMPAFEAIGNFIRDRVVPIVKQLAEGAVQILTDRLSATKKALSDAGPFFDLLKNAAKGLWAMFSNVLIPVLGVLIEKTAPLLNLAIRGIGKALGKVGEAGKVMWNLILQPVFQNMAKAIGKVLGWLSELFSAMASIPGAPKWIGKTADALNTGANKARDVSDAIKKIPDSHTVNINMNVTGRESIRAAEEEVRRLKAAVGAGRDGTVNSSGGDPGNQAYRRTGATG